MQRVLTLSAVAVAAGYNVRSMPAVATRALTKLSGGQRTCDPAMDISRTESGEFGACQRREERSQAAAL